MSRIAWLAGAVVLIAGAAATLSLRWDSTDEPAAEATPRRIASLTLASDEILAELAPDRVIAVTYLVDDADISNASGIYPASLPRLHEKDVERLVAMRPELVCVAGYNDADFLEVVRRSQIPTHRTEAFGSIDDIEATILSLGDRIGNPEKARLLVGRMRRRIAAVVDRVEDVPYRPRVMYWSGGHTAGESTTIDEIIRAAGGRNAAARFSGASAVAPEQMLTIDPDVVLLSRWKAYEADNRIDNQPSLRGLRALHEGKVIAVEARYLTTLSHAVAEGVERLARLLHPDRFAIEEGEP